MRRVYCRTCLSRILQGLYLRTSERRAGRNRVARELSRQELFPKFVLAKGWRFAFWLLAKAVSRFGNRPSSSGECCASAFRVRCLTDVLDWCIKTIRNTETPNPNSAHRQRAPLPPPGTIGNLACLRSMGTYTHQIVVLTTDLMLAGEDSANEARFFSQTSEALGTQQGPPVPRISLVFVEVVGSSSCSIGGAGASDPLTGWNELQRLREGAKDRGRAFALVSFSFVTTGPTSMSA